ncbi:hypothetical protein [cf. Phormidesmis sp. LEGE 11477]|uniref:hypothetical protein n=1 Tax=cf. Phormidesmis sp. LEGE 11477 TaxID=1828680 RepID=UPI00187F0353|nr:hypothetical protein [cf. Phormidesmis sp. LEGE 11477]MBE9064523.1 hypothetical protein [cf. Phormidesmis sp. LEGE 11477]
MNVTILCLVLAVLALTILHVPSVMLTLGIVVFLVGFSVKFFWTVLQTFSSPEPIRE